VTATLTQPEVERTDVDDELDHLICCDDDTAFCGLDVSDMAEGHTGEQCPLCALVNETSGCPHCGETWE
jgi:hypothetical protein